MKDLQLTPDPIQTSSMLFPMEQVFEDFVSHGFRRHQQDLRRGAPGSATPDGTNRRSRRLHDETRPSLSWTGIAPSSFWTPSGNASIRMAMIQKHGIDQGRCVPAIRVRQGPMNPMSWRWSTPAPRIFRRPLQYRILDGPRLICLPFDVEDPEDSVTSALSTLCNPASKSGLPGIRSGNWYVEQPPSG